MSVTLRLWRVAAVLSVLFAMWPDAVAQQSHTIQGRVLDNADKGIVGVQIQVLRGERQIGQDQTKVNGQYSVAFDDGGPIDTVRFDHSDYFPGVVQDISGRNSHRVYKTLHRRGQRLSLFQTQDIIQAFERVQEIDRRGEKITLYSDLYNYRAALEELDRQELPEFRDRLNRIKVAYGIR